MKANYSELVYFSALEQLKCTYKETSISISWVEKDRMRDKDNIAAGIKFILDGLVDAAILEEDGWNQIRDINHKFEIDKNNPRIEIEIRENKE